MLTFILKPIRHNYLQATAMLLLVVNPTSAQIERVVVGITPACPYGLSACWAGAREGLIRLDGVELVKPDYQNCTAEIELKKGQMPDLSKWADQFKQVVGQVYGFRGIEVTMTATLIKENDTFVLETPFLKQQVLVVPIRKKLQWDFQKSMPKSITPTESNAYQQARSLVMKTAKNKVPMIVTGPLITKNNQLVLELRTFTTLPD